jgi:hypothetical protein
MGGPERECSFSGDFERKVGFYQETLFAGESERYVKEGNRQISLYMPRQIFAHFCNVICITIYILNIFEL